MLTVPDCSHWVYDSFSMWLLDIRDPVQYQKSMGQGKEAHHTGVEQQGSRFEGLAANNTPCLHSLSPFQISKVWECMVNHLNYSNNLNWRLFSLFRLWRRQAWLAVSHGRVEAVCFLHWELSIKGRIPTQSTRRPTPKSASWPQPCSNTKRKIKYLNRTLQGKNSKPTQLLKFQHSYLKKRLHLSTLFPLFSEENQRKCGWLHLF